MVPVVFRLPGQPDFSLDFVVDTGFTDFLTLPPDVIAMLGLPFEHYLDINLADDSVARVAIHRANILWHGIEYRLRVIAAGKRPLLGTALLDRNRLDIDFSANGIVQVTEQP